ncbi:MAG: hypothetical protein JXR78_16180 [Victivallales bacterium]|nr:hypothetical protein [Victivallales bacterium]
MKTSLWVLGSLLAADALYLSYFYVIRADYYFPGRYEDAFAATFYALLLGLPVLGAFVVVLVIHLLQRRRLGRGVGCV